MTRLEQLATLSQDELIKRLMDAEAGRKPGKLTVKTSPKGAITILGVGSKFGVTQYPETWMALFSISDEIKKHIVERQAELSFKRGIPEFNIPPSAVAPAEE
jgi:hypothetical protein